MHTSFIKSITLPFWQTSILLLFLQLNSKLVYSQNRYSRLMDSADVYLASDPDRSIAFLKKIPRPLESSMKGNLAEYYESLAFAYYHKDNFGMQVRHLTTAILYAEKEGKYSFAGDLCIELFTTKRQAEDRADEQLLQRAEKNYRRANDETGLLEIIQARVYDHYVSKNYTKCYELGLANREKFKAGDDNFIDLINDYLICSAYLRANDIKHGKEFYNIVLTFKGEPQIDERDFNFHITSLNFDLAYYYHGQKNLDSASYYLKKVAEHKDVLDYTLEWEYYRLGAKISSLAGDFEAAAAFQDSVIELDRSVREAALKANVEANEKLVSTSDSLNSANSNNNYVVFGIVFLILILTDILVLMFFYRGKIKHGAHTVQSKSEEIFSAHKKEQKLSAKIIELEKYLMDIRSEVKNISNEDEHNEQRSKLSELYKDINLKSNIIQDENSLPLTNEVNADFFIKLRGFHPTLNDSELAICYYLFLGFKNKEIAIFRNATVRSIESKRFRLVKKLDLPDKQVNLVAYLNELFRSE